MSGVRRGARADESFSLDDTAVLLASPLRRHRPSMAASRFLDSTAYTSAMDMSSTFLPGEISKFYNQSMLAEAAEPLETLAQAFFDVINTYANNGSPFDAINQFHRVCEDFIKTGEGKKHNALLEQWLVGEKNTWLLVEALYRDRLHIKDEPDAPMELTHSEKEASEELYRRDSVVRQSQLVVDWLEKAEADRMAQSPMLRAEHFSEKTVCWENTVYQLKNGHKMAGQPNSGYTLNLITEADPDAPIRQKAQVHKMDAEDDALLLSQILSHIRCGQLEQAQLLCVHCGQQWRAATLEGWRLYHNPNLNEEGEVRVLKPTEGNPNRDLWKLAAWRMAEDQRVPQVTRTTYAALCGNLQVMLPSMVAWSDWLWAHLKTMLDVKIEEEIRERVNKDYVEMPPNYWSNKLSLKQIFALLAACPNPEIRAGNSEDFPMVQRAIILDDMPTLYATLVNWARQHKDLTAPKSPLLLRFAAHLILVLRQIGKEETELCAQQAAEVLRIYALYVMNSHKPELVISYVSQLPEREQVETLATYLEGITEPDLKAHCLLLANNLGLDVEQAAQKVVVAIREKPQQHPDEEAKVEALDWLVICPSQGGEALWHANALVRQFVANGKLELAAAAYAKIPQASLQPMLQKLEQTNCDEEDTSLPSRHKAAIREYMCFNVYLDAHKDFNEWLHHLHQKKPLEPEPLAKEATFQQKLIYEESLKNFRKAFAAWRDKLDELSELCKKRFVNILTFPDGGWLQDKTELEPGLDVTTRQAEMDSLVRLLLPRTATLFHEICLKSGKPQGSLELATIIASETHCLYKHFNKKDLRELLQKITESSVQLLKSKHDSFGFEATS